MNNFEKVMKHYHHLYHRFLLDSMSNYKTREEQDGMIIMTTQLHHVEIILLRLRILKLLRLNRIIFIMCVEGFFSSITHVDGCFINFTCVDGFFVELFVWTDAFEESEGFLPLLFPHDIFIFSHA